MRQLSWKRLTGEISQFAYVVEDLESAVDDFRRRLNVGPWYVMDHFHGSDWRYRGEPTNVDVSLALAFNGNVSIELIMQHNDVPSVFRDGMKGGRFGFHHFGIVVDDFDAEMQRYLTDGWHETFSAIVAGGARVAYVDGPDLPGMIEVIEASPAVEDIYGIVYRAAQEWDGDQPLRRF